jgi:hypothetical protein
MAYTGDVKLAANAIKTLYELIYDSILLRTYGNTTQRQQAADRVTYEVKRLYLTPRVNDVFMIDSYGGVRNGRVVAGADGITLAAANFTGSTNGGLGDKLVKDVRYFIDGPVNLGTLVLYSGGTDTLIGITSF